VISFLTSILGFFSGVWDFAAKVLEYLKEKSLVAMGRSLEQGDIAKRDAEATREASEILAKEVTKEQTVEKLKDGTF
jgi:hypothetical protein